MMQFDTVEPTPDTAATEATQYRSLTIAQAMCMIQSNEIVLPLLQRDLVWEAHKALSLFDSVLQNYPINSMLLWDIAPSSVEQVPMYSFIRHFTTYLGQHANAGAIHNNVRISLDELRGKADTGNLLAVLDGQQRLASFYMGLTGSYAWREKHGWDSKAHNFPPRQLFLRVIEGGEETTPDNLEEQPKYKLAWKRVSETELGGTPKISRLFRWEAGKRELWLRVGAVLDFQPVIIHAEASAKDWAAAVLQELLADDSLGGSTTPFSKS